MVVKALDPALQSRTLSMFSRTSIVFSIPWNIYLHEYKKFASESRHHDRKSVFHASCISKSWKELLTLVHQAFIILEHRREWTPRLTKCYVWPASAFIRKRPPISDSNGQQFFLNISDQYRTITTTFNWSARRVKDKALLAASVKNIAQTMGLVVSVLQTTILLYIVNGFESVDTEVGRRIIWFRK